MERHQEAVLAAADLCLQQTVGGLAAVSVRLTEREDFMGELRAKRTLLDQSNGSLRATEPAGKSAFTNGGPFGAGVAETVLGMSFGFLSVCQ